MKVVGFNGSPRKDGNTELLLQTVCSKLKENGAETEIIQIGNSLIHGCTGCRKCYETQNEQCIITTDEINSWVQKVIQADVLLLGSPVYFADITPEMKAFIDRVGYILRSNGNPQKHKIAAGVVAVRRAGGLTAFDSINRFFLVNQMIVVGSSYWNVGIGREKGDVLSDEEGMKTMKTLAENIFWTWEKLNK